MPRSRILRRRSDIQSLFATGRRMHNRWLTLITGKPASTEGPQVAFLVPKKVGTAVVRNRLRRRLREIHRHDIAPLHPPVCLWLAKPPATTLAFAELKAIMLQLAAR